MVITFPEINVPTNFTAASLVAQIVKNPPAESIPGLERSLGEENGNPLQYCCLENSMGRGTQQGACGRKESDITEQLMGLHLHVCTYTHTHTPMLVASSVDGKVF